MIKPLILLAGITCAEPTVINNTEYWTTHDEWSFQKAQTRCAELFPEAPCLKIFKKKEENLYNAICGEQIK